MIGYLFRYGINGQAENVWLYTLKGYFRDDPALIYKEIKRKSPFLANFGIFEIAISISFVVIGFIINWRCMLFLVPFYYLGHCLSSLNGFYEHWRGNPDKPIAWGGK